MHKNKLLCTNEIQHFNQLYVDFPSQLYNWTGYMLTYMECCKFSDINVAIGFNFKNIYPDERGSFK